MSDDRKYSRVYHDAVDDPRFEGVWTSDPNLALWLRLLILAEGTWPSPAPIPRSAKSRPLAALVESGLVELVSGDHFRIHGMTAERMRRSKQAAHAADVRWHGSSNADGNARSNAEVMPRQAETSKDEQRLDEHSAHDPADIYWELTGKFPAGRSLSWIDEMTTEYGAPAVSGNIAGAFAEDRTVGTLLGRAQDRLRAGVRQLNRSEKAEEQARLAEKRAKPVAHEPWQDEFRAAVEAHYAALPARIGDS